MQDVTFLRGGIIDMLPKLKADLLLYAKGVAAISSTYEANRRVAEPEENGTMREALPGRP